MKTYHWEQSKNCWEVPNLPITKGATHYTRIFRHAGPNSVVLADVFGIDEKDVMLNGKLISAAPDLLTALEKLCGIEAWIQDDKMKTLFQETVYPAIKKATE